ncbi:thaumatin-like protein 1a [Pistacia vera]|uniref:thaumatin-like protein 1a n=1 Tax=Pistacia vera TaxID=55513 RepID=UPI001263B249|nr:thaumatin-like protein 1a [Pistacia vera]
MAVMSAQLIFCLTLAFLVSGAHLATVSIKNNCPYTIWPATLANSNRPQLSETGFELASGGTKTLDIPAQWAGRFWARTGCSGSFTCATADCGSGQVQCNGKSGATPASLVEITFQADDGQDYYNLSLVDGFNLPVSVAPQGGSGTRCTQATCSNNVNAACPENLRLTGSDGNVIGCKNTLDNATFFKSQCPEAYSYPQDDQVVRACTAGANYAITFCP